MQSLAMSLFFAFGFCTVLLDTLVPTFRAMFALSYTQLMLTQFSYFGAYFIVSLPAGWLLSRIGYLRAIVLGLVLMATGAFGFIPAALAGVYPGFLAALFVLAAGVTVVQVAANPLTALAGPADQAASRLTLAQAFNSLATTLVPLFGAYFILAHLQVAPRGGSAAALAVFRRSEARVLIGPFAAIGCVLLAFAGVCWGWRRAGPTAVAQNAGSLRRLLGKKRLMLGALTIFAYVGAEVSIGSSLVNYLMQGTVLGVMAVSAGRLASLYWGGAMVGRFAGSVVLRAVPAGLALATCAVAAGACTLVASASVGWAAAAALLGVGVFNSIMFPTIFTLAIEGLGTETPEASGIICLAIVGGAIVPLLTGAVADQVGLSRALVVPAGCYGWIAGYGAWVWAGAAGAGWLRRRRPGRSRRLPGR